VVVAMFAGSAVAQVTVTSIFVFALIAALVVSPDVGKRSTESRGKLDLSAVETNTRLA
jgi:hypothetical protein